MTHLSALAGLIVPLGNILGPLIVWLVKKDESRFVDHQGKEAMNFQITMAIVVLLAGVVMIFGAVFSVILIGIPFLVLGMLAMMVFALIAFVFAIIGGVKANEGVWYRYPMTWRFIQ